MPRRSAELSVQIARVAPLDADDVEHMRHEALAARVPWIAEYREYQSGGWWTASLLNDSGEPGDVIIRDCKPVATSLLNRMPHTRRVLDSLGLRFMWVRIARLAGNSFLWEHRDYGKLTPVERYRLHIPLSTTSSAYLVVGGSKVHLGRGHVWRLTPTFAHGAVNLYGPDRIHLILDCYADAAFERFTAGTELLDHEAMPLPTVSRPELDHHMSLARQMLELGYRSPAETYLLRMFYRYRLPLGGSYDLIADAYRSAGQPEAADLWQAKKKTMLGIGQ